MSKQGCGSAGVCVLGNFVAWGNASMPACLCDVFILFFLQRLGSRVVLVRVDTSTGTSGFIEWRLLD